MDLPKKYILMTGVTSGIGLVLAERVAFQFKQTHQLHICITCRNIKKGQSLKNVLAINHQSVEVTLIKLDVGIVKSVLQGCSEIKKIFPKFDCVYLNAGIMPVERLCLKHVIKTIFVDLNARKILDMFQTGRGMFVTRHHINDDGVNNIFATNLLGHFILVRELLPLLTPEIKSETSQIIWTTSSNGCKEYYNSTDIAYKNGSNAYGHSKYVLEANSIEFNKRHNDIGIYSHVSDPGTVITNLTGSIVPFWLWYIAIPFLWLVRLVMPSLTISPYNACHSLLWLAKQNPADLDPDSKYSSHTTVTNSNYITREDLNIDHCDAQSTYEKTSLLADEVVAKQKSCEN